MGKVKRLCKLKAKINTVRAGHHRGWDSRRNQVEERGLEATRVRDWQGRNFGGKRGHIKGGNNARDAEKRKQHENKDHKETGTG